MNNKLNIAITVFTCGLILLPGCSRETFRSQALDSDFSYVNDGAGMSIVDDREIKKHLVDMDFVYLIEHLDDPTTGGVVYVSDDGESTPVPMGFICLDILLAGVRSATGGAGFQPEVSTKS